MTDFVLTPKILISAYSQGIFPMAHNDGHIYWYDPDPRTILPLDTFHISRSLARTVRKQKFEVRVNTAFEAVIKACAEPAPDRETTWIDQNIITAYTQLHHLGFAHSVESWLNNTLVGGLYGVSLRGLFAGESMFSRQTDASKVALVHLVNRMKTKGLILLDVQFSTPHLEQFGIISIPREEYKNRLAQALEIPAQF